MEQQNLMEQAVRRVLGERMALPGEGLLAPIAQRIGRRGQVSVAEYIVLTLATKAADGDRGAAEVLYKIARDMPDATQPPQDLVIQVRMVEEEPPVDWQALALDATRNG